MSSVHHFKDKETEAEAHSWGPREAAPGPCSYSPCGAAVRGAAQNPSRWLGAGAGSLLPTWAHIHSPRPLGSCTPVPSRAYGMGFPCAFGPWKDFGGELGGEGGILFVFAYLWDIYMLLYFESM